MSRRAVALALAVLALAASWSPVIKPAGQAAILLLDVFSEGLVGTDLARFVTPTPRVSETSETFAGQRMRVTSWRPGWGSRHPAILVAPGASPLGNDNEALRAFGASLARAGYLVVLPEFPFLKEGRLDVGGPAQLDAAFAHVRALPETRGRAVGGFGVSVGAGALFVGAGREPALRQADFLAVLGAYYDIDTYLASVAGGQQAQGGVLVPWQPSAEARERIPIAAVAAVPEADREVVRQALAPATYDGALARIRALPPGARAVYDALSPETVWSRIGPPVFWIHDPNDTFEPLAEAEAAAAAPRDGRFVLVVPRLISHAATSTEQATGEGPLFVVGELWRLLAFTFEVLRIAG